MAEEIRRFTDKFKGAEEEKVKLVKKVQEISGTQKNL